ncbi:MAG TPA: glycoside hydrolase family 38 C-terminal domain-containing protein, partial [Actinopolymorphaceae bacterium]
LGYRLYRICPTPTTESATVPPTAEFVLENDHLRMEVDPATGWLASLYDKATGAELVAGSRAPHTVVSEDPTDTWGHRVVTYALDGKPFQPRVVSWVECGPVRSIVRVESSYGGSTLIEELVLGRDARHLEVRVTLDWHEQLKLAKLRFPTRLTEPTATYEIPYAHLERPADGAEEPGQTWVDVSGTLPDGRRAGVTIVNDAKYAYDVSGGDIGITIARSPVYAWHEPRELEPDGRFSYHDQGRQRFCYLVVPHAGDWRAAGVVRTAAEHVQRPVTMFESYHTGRLPGKASFAEVVDGDHEGGEASVVPTVLKLAEDSDEQLVVRAFESAGRAGRLRLDLPMLDRTVEADFRPHEIKTLLVPTDPQQPVVEADALEDPREGEG